MSNEQHSTRALAKAKLFGKVTVCFALFTSIFVWGWRTEQDLRKLHHKPALEILSEDEIAHDVSIVREIELGQEHIFLPRQYVKILRWERVDEGNQGDQGIDEH